MDFHLSPSYADMFITQDIVINIAALILTTWRTSCCACITRAPLISDIVMSRPNVYHRQVGRSYFLHVAARSSYQFAYMSCYVVALQKICVLLRIILCFFCAFFFDQRF